MDITITLIRFAMVVIICWAPVSSGIARKLVLPPIALELFTSLSSPNNQTNQSNHYPHVYVVR
jgi:hypothetical protein